jgi:hypothetical protein
MKILNAIVFIFLVVSCSDTPKRSSIEKTTYHEKLEFIKKMLTLHIISIVMIQQ